MLTFRGIPGLNFVYYSLHLFSVIGRTTVKDRPAKRLVLLMRFMERPVEIAMLTDQNLAQEPSWLQIE